VDLGVLDGTAQQGPVQVWCSWGVLDGVHGWLRCPAVERQSLAGVLSLSCARPVADG